MKPMNTQWIRLIVIVALLSISVISWAAKKLAEQRQIKQAREARERLAEQVLRTGRTEDGVAVSTVSTSPAAAAPNQVAGHADARRRLQELAERRQRQLEELRRKQGQGGQGQSTVTSESSPVPTIERAPASRTTEMGPNAQPMAPAKPRQAPPPPPRRVPSKTQQSRPQQGKQAPSRQAQPKRAAKPQTRKEALAANQPARDRAGRTPEQAALHAIADEAEQTALQPAQLQQLDAVNASRRQGSDSIKAALAGARGGGMSANEWRRVIMMREILDKPMSMREASEEGREG